MEKTLHIDHEYIDNKLKGYVEINPKDLCDDDHFRYTKNIYKQEGRKCCYAVVVSHLVDEMKLVVKGYKSEYKPWTLDYSEKGNRYKCVKFYIKKEDVDGTFAENEDKNNVES